MVESAPHIAPLVGAEEGLVFPGILVMVPSVKQRGEKRKKSKHDRSRVRKLQYTIRKMEPLRMTSQYRTMLWGLASSILTATLKGVTWVVHYMLSREKNMPL